MSENADFRANLGCVNGRNENLRIFIDLYGDDGEPLETKTMDLAPFEQTAQQDLQRLRSDRRLCRGQAHYLGCRVLLLRLGSRQHLERPDDHHA